MGRLDIVIPDDIENKLRKRVALRGKGAISKAIAEALTLWFKESKVKP